MCTKLYICQYLYLTTRPIENQIFSQKNYQMNRIKSHSENSDSDHSIMHQNCLDNNGV